MPLPSPSPEKKQVVQMSSVVEMRHRTLRSLHREKYSKAEFAASFSGFCCDNFDAMRFFAICIFGRCGMLSQVKENRVLRWKILK
jgi:hypothetical protein